MSKKDKEDKRKRKKNKNREETVSQIEVDPIAPEPEELPGKAKKLETLESTQMWSPIKDIKDGIVITKDGRYVQILEFAPINFHLRSAEEQYIIANVFGSSIRIFPRRFQIKILSRRANVESHIRELRSFLEQETNPQCRLMQQESIQQILQQSRSGVSKRFFVSFEYEPPAGIQRSSWSDIRAALTMQSNQIVTRLSSEPCTNTLIGAMDNTDHTLSILYDCMNRAEAEIKSLDTKINDIVAAYLMEGKLTDDNMTIPLNDFLAPQSIRPDISSKFIEVDGKYHAYGYIPKHAYKTECYPGWLSLLVNMGEGIDVDIFVEKQAPEKVKQKLTKAMNLTQANLNSKDDTAADYEDMAGKLTSGKYIRAGLSNEQDFMYFSIMLSIVAPSEEILKKKIEWVQGVLIPNNLSLRMLNFKHDLAFKMSLPLCNPNPRIFKHGARNILSGDFGAAYPFTSYEINDRGGIMVGMNQANRTPIFINQFDQELYNNGNMAIFGSPGSGKTYLLQCLAMRMRQQQIQTIIIAPYKGHEFRRACRSVGGQFISIAPGSSQNINIMEIRKYDITNQILLDGDEVTGNSLLSAKISQLKIFFNMIMDDEKGMSVAEDRLLEDALKKTYSKFGITFRNKSLIDPGAPGQYKKMPVLGDLYRILQESKGTERLTDALYMFVEGSARSFNAQTNVNLDNPYVVIDVSQCTKDMLPVAIFMVTDYVSDLVKADRTKKKAIIWDELHRLIGPDGTPEAAAFVFTCWKIFRAYRAVCICATQDSNDFLSERNRIYGQGILSASKLKVIMKVEQLDAQALSSIIGLSPGETQQIQYFDRGEALLIANRNHAMIKVTASELEDDLISTDPSQLERKLKHLQKQEGNS